MSVVNFQGALRLRLLSEPSIAALIEDRLYTFPAPMNLSQTYMMMQLISEEDYGNLNAGDGIVVERWQFDIFSKAIDAAIAVKIAVFEALNYMQYSYLSGYKIYVAKRESGVDNWDAGQTGEEDGWHRISQDYKIKRNITAT